MKKCQFKVEEVVIYMISDTSMGFVLTVAVLGLLNTDVGEAPLNRSCSL